MAITLRQIILGTVPTIAAILGFIWFRRKKKNPEICDKPKEEIDNESTTFECQQPNGSVPRETFPSQKTNVFQLEESILSSMVATEAVPSILAQSDVSLTSDQVSVLSETLAEGDGSEVCRAEKAELSLSAPCGTEIESNKLDLHWSAEQAGRSESLTAESELEVEEEAIVEEQISVSQSVCSHETESYSEVQPEEVVESVEDLLQNGEVIEARCTGGLQHDEVAVCENGLQHDEVVEEDSVRHEEVVAEVHQVCTQNGEGLGAACADGAQRHEVAVAVSAGEVQIAGGDLLNGFGDENSDGHLGMNGGHGREHEEGDTERTREECDAERTQEEGDTERTQEEGDTETQEEGDTERTQEEGDTERTQEEGDTERTQEEGDTERTQEEGDKERTQVEGDAERTQEEGDTERTQEEGDTERTQEEGDTERTQEEGDAERTQEECDSERTQEECDSERTQELDCSSSCSAMQDEVLNARSVSVVKSTPVTDAQDVIKDLSCPGEERKSMQPDENANVGCEGPQVTHCDSRCKSESEVLDSAKSVKRTELEGVPLTNGDHSCLEQEPQAGQLSGPTSCSEPGAPTIECDQVNCDAKSEVSSDSGRGASCIETPTATSPSEQLSEYMAYEFHFPTDLCGRLIGRYGKNVNIIKSHTGAEISVRRVPFVQDFQSCLIEGTQSQVTAALEQIKHRFPRKQFPEISYTQTNIMEASPVLSPELMQLSLPEGVSVDVIVSSVVDANHVFIQQPTHPTFSSLENLNYYMNLCYTQDSSVPALPRLEPGYICAAPIFTGWFRAQVVAVDHELDECDIKFVDYGGYLHVHSSALRQIRSDFATLPFQAIECYMSNVVPPRDDEGFGPEASAILEEMVHGQMLQAQIVGHEEDGIPYVQLYKSDGLKNIFVNRELVNMGVARWVEVQQ